MRDAELAALTADLAAAVGGAGRVTVVEAPAGTGKTWLAEAVLTRAAERGAAVVRAHCPDDEGAPVLWPWAQALRRLGLDLPAGTLDLDAAARFQLFDEITRRLLAAAPPGGLVLLLEDLHWADEATLRLLRHLAGEVSSSRMLVIVTTRPSPANRPVVAEVLRRPGGRLIDLPPFGRGEVAEVLGTADAALVDEVWSRCGGSPLLVTAVARLRHGSEVPWERVARGADGLVEALTAGLTPEQRQVLRVAAVAGEQVDPALVAAVAERPLAEVEAALSRSGVIEIEGPPVAYRFAHALIRDAVRAELDGRAEERLHQALADRLTGTARAAHLLRAGADPAVLREACADAAREAEAGLGFEDAARWWGRALAAGETSEVLLDLARTEYRGGDLAAAQAHCERAVRHDASVAGAAALILQGLGSPEVSRIVLEWCEAALRAGPDEVLRARLLAQKACALEELGRPDEAGEVSRVALELARAVGDPDALLDAARARAMRLPTPENVTEFLELGTLAITHAETRPMAAVWGHVWRVDACWVLGNLDQVAAETEAVGRLARTARMPLATWFDLRLRATRAQFEGRFAESSALSFEAGELAGRLGDRSGVSMTYAHALFTALFTGDPDRLPADYDASLRLAPPMPIVRASAAAAAFLRGDTDRARALYEELRPLIRADDDHDRRRGGLLGVLTWLVAGFEDVEAAGWMRRAWEPWAGYRGGVGTATVVNAGSARREIGRMAALEGRRDDAVRWLNQAIEVDTRLGGRPFVVLARLDLAAALGPGPEAEELAGLAGREAARLGMPGSVARAKALKTLTAGVGPAELTRREREIAALVAEALSNREIAARLVLSERTVESHVRNILTKLGFAGRMEIATWAIRAIKSH